MKIHQQPNSQPTHFQIRQKLGFVNGDQSLYCLYFEYDRLINNNVRTISTIEFHALISHRQRCLTRKADPCLAKLIA